jgi:hypothetical protein
MQTPELPAPLSPPGCNLSGVILMPLDVQRFRRSKLVSRSDRGFRAGFLLTVSSWHQVPCGSIINNEEMLAYLAGFRIRAWRAISNEALEDWTLCSDGRWYHPDVCLVAIEEWTKRLISDARSAIKRGSDFDVDRAARSIEAAVEYLPAWTPLAGRAESWLRRIAERERLKDPNLARRRAAGLHALRMLDGGR